MTTSHSEFEDVMLDIESMSLHPHNALILSIGAIEFNPYSPSGLKLGSRMLVIPSIHEQLLLGREVDPGTQKFWADQPLAASAHWREQQQTRLVDVCSSVSTFLLNAKRVWANHIMFDLANIDGLFRQVMKTRGPWHYRAPYDMPSFCNEHPPTNGGWHKGDFTPEDDPRHLPEGLIDHHPVDDSIRQAYRVWEHWPEDLN